MNTPALNLWRFPLSWTMASLCMAVSLHVTRLPLPMTLMFAGVCLWRVWLTARSRTPPRLAKFTVVLVVLLMVLTAYRTLNGIAAGTALLALMAGMKLVETRTRRDHVIILLICYFLVLAAFLRDQSFWLVPVHTLAVWVTTAALLRVTQSHETLAPRECLALSGRMLLQAAPLMLVMFLFFPRIPGPFWALPGEERGTSGLSEEMNPGDISELTLSDDVAFRARFRGSAPPPAQRYWRGPVLHEFDGNIWRAPRGYAALGGPVEYAGPQYDYSLMMEASGRRWIFALDMAQTWQGRLFRTFDYQLLASSPLDRAVTLQMSSRTAYVAGEQLSHTLRQLDSRLPPDRNPRARVLAQRLRADAQSDSSYIQNVLALFREQPFVYTLTPPKLDPDSVDDFLFNTRSGFCAHYASAFTMLMRAAGIPARVVTGYQGGEYNRLGDYWIVRQADAHAWSEVWLAGRGWVRVDPTTAVAPERIERGSAGIRDPSAARDGSRSNADSWLVDLRFVWDTLNTAWRERILEFNDRSQVELLERLGWDEADWRALAILLGGGLTIVLLLLAIVLARELEFRHVDPALRAYRRFCRRLERRGIERPAHEGPLDFSRRLRRLRPDLAPQTDAITQLYVNLRYGAQADSATLDQLIKRVSRFKPRAAPPRTA